MKKTKLEKLANEILEVTLIIETVRDACTATDYASGETVLDIALKKQYDIYDEIELMY